MLQQGYLIDKVIGVGNCGTTFQVDDKDKNHKIVLKIYHEKNSVRQATNEFEMLYSA